MSYQPEDIPEFLRPTETDTVEDQAKKLVMAEIERLSELTQQRQRENLTKFAQALSYEDLCFLSEQSQAELSRRNSQNNTEGY